MRNIDILATARERATEAAANADEAGVYATEAAEKAEDVAKTVALQFVHFEHSKAFHDDINSAILASLTAKRAAQDVRGVAKKVKMAIDDGALTDNPTYCRIMVSAARVATREARFRGSEAKQATLDARKWMERGR
jgi:hypothetical protein